LANNTPNTSNVYRASSQVNNYSQDSAKISE
jgi:hypothetical protein